MCGHEACNEGARTSCEAVEGRRRSWLWKAGLQLGVSQASHVASIKAFGGQSNQDGLLVTRVAHCKEKGKVKAERLQTGNVLVQ